MLIEKGLPRATVRQVLEPDGVVGRSYLCPKRGMMAFSRNSYERCLDGARILVVDDEAMIALDIEMTLMDAGALVSGPFLTLGPAVEAAGREELSAALLDIRLGPVSSEDIAAVLAERGVPFCFYSGQDLPETVRMRWPDSQVISKPAQPEYIVAAVAALVRTRRGAA